MAQLLKSRTAQWPLLAEFTFEIGDTMTNVAGNPDAFATVADHVFDVMNLPIGAVVIGGDITTETAVTGSTAYNVKVGDATTDNRYLGTTNRLAAGRTALVPTGYVSDGKPVRLTVSPTVATATAGKLTLRVEYMIKERGNEVS